MPSKINWIDRAHSKMAIILDKTCKNFVLINFSYLIAIKKNIKVINKTKKSDVTLYKEDDKLNFVVLELIITEVIAAGPARSGTARGYIAE